MNPEITKIIEQYLANELSPSDKIAFEKKLAENKALQDEVIRQQNIHAAAKRASKRTEIQQIGKSYHFIKKVFTTGIVVAIIVVVSALGYLAYKMTNNSEADFSQSEEVKALIEKLKKESPIDELASEFFFWEGKDSVILSDEGVLLSVPENAFLLKGKPYNEKAIIQWQEAIDPATIVKSGLSTMAGDRLLETQGMFGVQAFTKEGEKLDVNPKVGVYVQVPVDQYKSGMQLFTGEKNKDGIIDWKNPKPLQKIPVPIDMKELDFYPKGYENTLNEMKKSKKKAYRDSLYLSFDGAGEYLPEPINTDSTSYVVDFLEDNSYPWSYKSKSSININNQKQVKEEISNLKWNIDVRYSQDGFATIIGRVPLASNWNIYSELDGDKTNNIHTNSRVGVRTDLKFGQNNDYQLIGNIQHSGRFIAEDNEGRIEQIREDEAIFKQRIKILNKQSFDLVINYTMQITNPSMISDTYISREIININPQNDTENQNEKEKFISPTKVMALWKPAFNKTLLATREFERRMQTIHTTCDNKVLNLYTSNLSKSMQEIDEMAVSMGYPIFAEFAKEHIGTLNPNNPHLKGLQSFYEREIKKLKRIVEANAKYDHKKQGQWDKEVQKVRDQEKNRRNNRKATNISEEYKFNLDNVYRQLDIVPSAVQFKKTLGFTIQSSGVYNIDKYVYDATVNRKSTVIKDPKTGKTAKITYNDFSFEVNDSKNFGKLYAYLFPSQLNSYQRISDNKGKFNYPLNGDIVYDLVVVGISDKGFYYQDKKGVSKGSLGPLTLNSVTEKEFNQNIKSINESRGIIKPMEIRDELYWLVKEQKNYIEEKRRNENAEFRQKIRKVIFPCYQGEVTYEFTFAI